MHPYATDSNERTIVMLLIAGVSIVLAWCVALLLKQLSWWENFWWLDVPAVPGFYSLLTRWFDKDGWKWPIWRTLDLVTVPDLNGEWEGTLRSSYDEFQTEHAIGMSIRQRWTSIAITVTAGRSRSVSRIAGVIVNNPSGAVLSYEYENAPSVDALETMHIHFGMAQLRLGADARGETMEGDYYTGRDRQNFGLMKLHRS